MAHCTFMDSVVFWLIKGKTPILFSSSSIKVLQVCDNCVPEGIVILGNSTAWSDLSCKEINGKQKKGLLCDAGNFYWCLTKPLVFLASMTAVSAGWLKTIKTWISRARRPPFSSSYASTCVHESGKCKQALAASIGRAKTAMFHSLATKFIDRFSWW